jgi:hypothetical protein
MFSDEIREFVDEEVKMSRDLHFLTIKLSMTYEYKKNSDHLLNP